MSLNKLTGQQNTGSERWMNIKANTLQAEDVTLKGSQVLIESQDGLVLNNFSTVSKGNPNNILITDGNGNLNFIDIATIDPSPPDLSVYEKVQNIKLPETTVNFTQIDGTTKLDIVTANSIELDGSDLTDDIADLQIKTTNISYLSGPNVTTVSNTLNNTNLIHASGDVQVDGNLQVQCTDTNLLSYKTANRGNNGDVLTSDGTGGVSFQPASSGSGDVVGPTSSVNDAVAFFDGTTGKLLKENTGIKYNSVDSQLEVPNLYISGSFTGTSLPVVTRFRCSPVADRTPTAGNAVYEDDYIRLGWDGGGQNDVQIRRKATSDAYISYCSKPNTLTIANVGVNTAEQTYELNGSISMVGGDIFYINMSPVTDNTAPAYRITVHFTENSVGTDGNVDWIVERFDKCSLV